MTDFLASMRDLDVSTRRSPPWHREFTNVLAVIGLLLLLVNFYHYVIELFLVFPCAIFPVEAQYCKEDDYASSLLLAEKVTLLLTSTNPILGFLLLFVELRKITAIPMLGLLRVSAFGSFTDQIYGTLIQRDNTNPLLTLVSSMLASLLGLVTTKYIGASFNHASFFALKRTVLFVYRSRVIKTLFAGSLLWSLS